MERPGRTGAAAVGLAAAAVGLGALVAGSPATGPDRAATRWARGLPDAVAAALWAPMQLGTLVGALAVAIAVGVWLGWRATVRAAASIGIAFWCSDQLKAVFDRPRLTAAALGAVPREVTHNPAYPSTHAAVAFALATAIALVDRRWGRWALGPAALVGLARMVQGVHTPIDLLGGAAVGAAAALLVGALDDVIRGRSPAPGARDRPQIDGERRPPA